MNEPARRAATERREIVEAVRNACARAAAQAYEDAGISGLCAEGRWESAIEAIRHLNLDAVVRGAGGPEKEEAATPRSASSPARGD